MSESKKMLQDAVRVYQEYVAAATGPMIPCRKCDGVPGRTECNLCQGHGTVMDCTPYGVASMAAVDAASITITIPRVDPVAIAELERLTLEAGQTEREAVEALLAFAGPLAKHGQNVKAGAVDLVEQGKVVTGFVAVEYDVNQANPARLYIAGVTGVFAVPHWLMATRHGGSCAIANPLAFGYQLADIVAGLARALEGLHTRLPQKIAKAEERAALAREVVAKIGALKQGGGA